MGYQIAYNLMELRKTKLKKPVPFWGKVVLLVICFLVCHYFFVMLQTVAGGQWDETIAASEQMVVALKGGATLREAAVVFCAELIG